MRPSQESNSVGDVRSGQVIMRTQRATHTTHTQRAMMIGVAAARNGVHRECRNAHASQHSRAPAWNCRGTGLRNFYCTKPIRTKCTHGSVVRVGRPTRRARPGASERVSVCTIEHANTRRSLARQSMAQQSRKTATMRTHAPPKRTGGRQHTHTPTHKPNTFPVCSQAHTRTLTYVKQCNTLQIESIISNTPPNTIMDTALAEFYSVAV